MNFICVWAPVLFFLFSIIEINCNGKQDTGKKIILAEPATRISTGLDELDYICESRMGIESMRDRLFDK